MSPEETGAGPTVVVTARSFGSGDADPAGRLQKAGLRVARADPAHQHAALEETLSGAVAWIAGTSPIDDRHLVAAPNLKVGRATAQAATPWTSLLPPAEE